MRPVSEIAYIFFFKRLTPRSFQNRQFQTNAHILIYMHLDFSLLLNPMHMLEGYIAILASRHAHASLDFACSGEIRFERVPVL